MVSVLRKFDVDCEQNFHKFLLNHLYPNMKNIISFHNAKDKEEQIKGIDISVISGKENYKGNSYTIDEKLAAHYLNCKKSNFVLELVTPNGGKGWFLNDDLETDIYLFCWGRLGNGTIIFDNEKRNNLFKNMKYEDIAGVYALFIQKSTIRRFFAYYGLTADILYNIAVDCRKKTPNRCNASFSFNKLHKDYVPRESYKWNNYLTYIRDIFCSGGLVERPVVIVIEQPLLFRFAFQKLFVTKDRIFTIKRAVNNMNILDYYFKGNERS